MRQMIAVALVALMGTGAVAGDGDILQVKAAGDVPSTMDALEDAVTGAGATVFARVDHAESAKGADMELAPAEVLIFGNPKVGTPAMHDDALAGLYLPMKVLVYRGGDGQVWLAYEDPAKMLSGLGGIDADAPYVQKMTGALKKLTGKAAGM